MSAPKVSILDERRRWMLDLQSVARRAACLPCYAPFTCGTPGSSPAGSCVSCYARHVVRDESLKTYVAPGDGSELMKALRGETL